MKKVGIIGNTTLTFKTIKFLTGQECEISYVFGLPEKSLKNKVNSYDLKKYCLQNNIEYYNNNDWSAITHKDVDIVYEMGDSRVVPPSFLQNNLVIGNHGATLPNVQGAASLVWGRMLNNGKWGVSLMRLSQELDAGSILCTKDVYYNPDIDNMEKFVEMCDDATIECVKEHFFKKNIEKENKRWEVRVAKGTDSKKVSTVLNNCLDNDINIYLPPRTPDVGFIKCSWDDDFIESFKKANDSPYPPSFKKSEK